MFVQTDRSTLAPDKWEMGDESIGVHIYGHILWWSKYKIYLFVSQIEVCCWSPTDFVNNMM